MSHQARFVNVAHQEAVEETLKQQNPQTYQNQREQQLQCRFVELRIIPPII